MIHQPNHTFYLKLETLWSYIIYELLFADIIGILPLGGIMSTVFFKSEFFRIYSLSIKIKLVYQVKLQF